jgi:hypothetical protein
LTLRTVFLFFFTLGTFWDDFFILRIIVLPFQRI